VRRPRATVFARTGYWSLKRGQNTDGPASLAPVISPAVQEAVNRLAESLRPNAEEPAEAPRRIKMPEAPAPPPPVQLLSPATISLARGRTIGDPVGRREFRRTDTIVVRAATTGEPALSARLLDHHGQRLADLPATPSGSVCELTLPLGNLGPGDYVIELSARGTSESAQQFVAFRLLR
jgi:hypothetical protein